MLDEAGLVVLGEVNVHDSVLKNGGFPPEAVKGCRFGSRTRSAWFFDAQHFLFVYVVARNVLNLLRIKRDMPIHTCVRPAHCPADAGWVMVMIGFNPSGVSALKILR
ncbi:hypothetical protein D3C87_1854470 [compost metagenome]